MNKMQIPKITPITIGIFFVTVCIFATLIYNYNQKKDEVPTMNTYIYSLLPAIIIGIIVVFGYDKYSCSSNNELLQESFYA